MARFRSHPSARLERRGELLDVALAEAPEMRQEINELMAAKYGWADSFVGIVGDRAAALPLRVDRIP